MTRFTHLDKIYYPKKKIKKEQVLDYYKKIARYILPFLKDRPLTVKRCPDGIEKECWIQKECSENPPKFVKIASFYAETKGDLVDYPVCNNLETLLWLSNLGSIEYHIWFSTFKKPEVPTFLIFDLDLEEEATFENAKEVAFLIKEELEKLKLESFPKTTGLSGLHVLAKNSQDLNYPQARNLVKKIVTNLDKKYPEKIATEPRIKERKGHIYIDPAQNSKGRTMVAPYSLRAAKDATVSTPLTWGELKKKIKPEDFDIFSIIKRRERA